MADLGSTDGTTADQAAGAGRAAFPGISSRAFEHPADRSALTALRSLQGFDAVLRKASGLVAERSLRLMHLGMAVRVGPRQFPAVYAMVVEAAAALDLDQVPELYLVNDPRVNAIALGLDRPFVVLHTATVDLMTDDELRFVVGHEVGHIASGHAVYRTLLFHLIRVAARVAWVPLGALGVRAVVTALEEWARKSELSADRAGLLVCQDPDAALRALMKTAGGSRIGEMEVDSFLAQAAEYDAVGDLRDSVLKLLSLQGQTHPFAVLRAAELRRWIGSGEYAQVLAGDYPLRADHRQTSLGAEVREATRSYTESVKDSADPLLGMVRDAAGAGQRWWKRISKDALPEDWFGTPDDGAAPTSTPARRTPAKKAAPARKSAVAKKAAPAKRVATAKKTTAKKTTAAGAATDAPAKKAPAAKKATPRSMPRKG